MEIIQQHETRRDISPIFIFALTLFSSASLMFVLQPMFGKALLPLLGGSASVWNTCMVFYQSILFFGYLYAHVISTRLRPQPYLLLHILVLLSSLFFLPVGLDYNNQPPTTENPSLWLLTTLFTAIGLPFFVLSTTSPLLQKWFSKIGHQTSHDPYYLSIASNSGSLLALLSYPFLLEPTVGLSLQQHYWSVGFLALIVMLATCMTYVKKQPLQTGPSQATYVLSKRQPGIKQKFQWLLLAFVPSSLLLGTTNYISIDIATVPLLWVIPLALYLLSFILVFSRHGKSLHKRFFLLQPWVIITFLIYYFSGQKLADFKLELFAHLSIFFISIMVCHGELAKKRPSTDYLTQYYLIMSFGGMLGGIFNSFVAPFIFNSIYEYPLMIVCALLLNPIHKRIGLYLKKHLARIVFIIYVLAFLLISTTKIELLRDNILIAVVFLSLLAAAYYFFKQIVFYFPLIALLAVSCATPNSHHGDQLLHQSRNFYGVLSVKKQNEQVAGSQAVIHEIYSGTTKHGLQFIDNPARECVPNGYYSPAGPLGSLFSNYEAVNQDWHIGVVGLGAGEMAGYSKASQQWTFFELDPAVEKLATNVDLFTYLSNCITGYAMQIGDARITLEQQRNRFDMLVIDAFTSDSIPTHLLTQEAIDLYMSRLNTKGLLVFHISNRYLELKKVLSDHAKQFGLAMIYQEYRPENPLPFVYRSDWAILARNEAILAPLLNEDGQNRWQKPADYADARSWTDDFTSLISVWK